MSLVQQNVPVYKYLLPCKREGVTRIAQYPTVTPSVSVKCSLQPQRDFVASKVSFRNNVAQVFYRTSHFSSR
eukprot:1963633-Pleurochrysis_carterae.AAC.5